MTISASGGSGPLQMVLEPDTKRCVSLLAVPRSCASKDAGPKGGGFGGDPTSIGGRKECQRGHWAPKGVDCDVPTWVGEENNHLL